MKTSTLAAVFLSGLALGFGLQSMQKHSASPQSKGSVQQPPPAASGPPTHPPQYRVLGAPDPQAPLPADAYKAFILNEDGRPRPFEEFKALLANSELVNADAANFGREALMVYAGALVRALGVNAIDEILKSPVLAEFGPTAPGMFEIMYAQHGKDAALKLISCYRNKQIRTMLYGMLASRSLGNHLEALQIAKQNAPGKLRDPSFVSHLVESASRRLSPEELLGFITTLESPQTRLLAAEAAGGLVWSPDPVTRQKILSTIMAYGDGPLRKALLDSYLAKAATLEPELLLNPAFAGARIDEGHFYTAGSVMSEKGWQTALAFGIRVSSDETRQRYMMGLVDATVASGDSSVMEKSIEAYRQGVDDGQMLARAVSAVARLSPEEAVKFLSRPDLPRELKETLSVECINDIATADLDQAKALLRNNQFAATTRDRIYADMARHLARENPEAAFSELASKISDPVYASIATREAAQEYFRSESNRCLDWLQRMGAGALRDQITSAVAHEMVKTDVHGALDLSTQITNAIDRVSSLATIYGNARYLQPALAESWARQNPGWIKAISDLETKAGAAQ